MTEQDVKMVLSGDLYVQREDPESIFAFTAPYLKGADVFFGNLEAAVTDRGAPTPAKEMGLFKSEERMFTAYTTAGLDAVGVANNHTMNYGTKGLLRTFELLTSEYEAVQLSSEASCPRFMLSARVELSSSLWKVTTTLISGW